MHHRSGGGGYVTGGSELRKGGRYHGGGGGMRTVVSLGFIKGFAARIIAAVVISSYVPGILYEQALQLPPV